MTYSPAEAAFDPNQALFDDEILPQTEMLASAAGTAPHASEAIAAAVPLPSMDEIFEGLFPAASAAAAAAETAAPKTGRKRQRISPDSPRSGDSTDFCPPVKQRRTKYGNKPDPRYYGPNSVRHNSRLNMVKARQEGVSVGAKTAQRVREAALQHVLRSLLNHFGDEALAVANESGLVRVSCAEADDRLLRVEAIEPEDCDVDELFQKLTREDFMQSSHLDKE